MTEIPPLITFYTVDTPYEWKVQDLKETAERHGLRVEAIPKRFDEKWVQVCAKKPEVISEWVADNGLPVVWLDADCEILCPPNLLRRQGDEVVAAARVRGKGGKLKVRSTVVVLYEGAEKLLEEWTRRCQENPDQWDQRVLQAILEEGGYPVRWLPRGYAWLKGLDRPIRNGPTVIQHIRRRLWHPGHPKYQQ